jgi:hypothetical protein
MRRLYWYLRSRTAHLSEVARRSLSSSPWVVRGKQRGGTDRSELCRFPSLRHHRALMIMQGLESGLPVRAVGNSMLSAVNHTAVLLSATQ